MFTPKKMPEIDAAVQEDDWKYLQDNHWPLAKAVEIRVNKGDHPQDIYRYIIRQVGLGREPIAKRCLHAAQFLQMEKEQGC